MIIEDQTTSRRSYIGWPQRSYEKSIAIFLILLSVITIIALAATFSGVFGDKIAYISIDGPHVKQVGTEAAMIPFGDQNQNSLHTTNKTDRPENLSAVPIVAKIKKNNTDEVCLTPGCVRAASHILNKMNETVEPCEDFYNFACGNFMKETIKSDDKVDSFSVVHELVQEQLRSSISERIDANDSAPIIMVKKLYNACMNTTRIEEQGLKPMLKIMDQLGGWPVIKGNEWNSKSEWSWTWAVQKLRRLGYSSNYIFSVSIVPDIIGTRSWKIGINHAKLGLEREYLVEGLENNVVKAYYEYMVDIAVIYGADRSRAKKELMESLEFEIKLAKIISVLSLLLKANISLKEVQQKYPYIQWVEYINALLPPPLSVDKNETIMIDIFFDIDDLGKLLQDTPNRVIANYMIWRVIDYSTTFHTDKLRKRQSVYKTVVHGNQEKETRLKECIDITIESLPVAVGALYVRNHFQPDSKVAALELVNLIRKEFELLLNEAIWMDGGTRQATLQKLKDMHAYVGYPDEIRDDAKIEKYYKNLKIDAIDNFLSFVLSLNVFNEDYAYNKLHQPISKTDWVTFQPAVVNAFYSPIENSIKLPAGILKGHFFSTDRPRYLDFGAIGSVIGHEITHGLSDLGAHTDLNGDKVDCIITQYENYTEPSTRLKVDGVKTKSENVADNVGLKVSYFAYKKWVKDNGPEPRLPDLKYTPQQMFWISAAQDWCSATGPTASILDSFLFQIIDTHSPKRFRVLGPFRNRPEFSKDFNCPKGSPMNPIEKCDVW